MKGKKYSREEWEAAMALNNVGYTWNQAAKIIGRPNGSIGRCIAKHGGDYDKYNASFVGGKGRTKRKTEQLVFEPPRVPSAPKKIHIKSMSEQEFVEKKMKLANAQYRAIQNFITELRNAGFRL